MMPLCAQMCANTHWYEHMLNLRVTHDGDHGDGRVHDEHADKQVDEHVGE